MKDPFCSSKVLRALGALAVLSLMPAPAAWAEGGYTKYMAPLLSDMNKTIDIDGKIPDVTLQRWEMKEEKLVVENFSTAKELGTGRVVLLTVPKAFTPTCSRKHLPRFMEKHDEFKRLGVKVAVAAVNTYDEMQAWMTWIHLQEMALESGKTAAGLAVDYERIEKIGAAVGEIIMLPDWSGNFILQLGLGMEKNARGLGLVAKRAVIFLKNGKVDHKLIIEEDAGLCDRTGANSVLEILRGMKLTGTL